MSTDTFHHSWLLLLLSLKIHIIIFHLRPSINVKLEHIYNVSAAHEIEEHSPAAFERKMTIICDKSNYFLIRWCALDFSEAMINRNGHEIIIILWEQKKRYAAAVSRNR